MKNSLRWDPYVLMKGAENIQTFWKEHVNTKERKILYILGKGFDIRMNEGIRQFITQENKVNINCLLITYNEGIESSSHDYQKFVDQNLEDLKSLSNINIKVKSIEIWKGKGRNKRRIGDKEASDIFFDYTNIKEYTDIIVDISALPRGIYFSLIGKLLTLIDFGKVNGIEKHNLLILTSENALIDQLTIEEDIDEDLKYSFGFGGGLELTSDDPVIWFPVLGENKRTQIIKAHHKLSPREICPLLPFPSKNPRRSDKLIIEYHQLLFDELRIESQNLLYVPEQNPFEVYRNLTNAIINYHETLSILNGCKAAISTFSSKLLSIGAILTAYELNSKEIGVGVLNVESNGYKIKEEETLSTINKNSELFLTWLTGEPYNKIT